MTRPRGPSVIGGVPRLSEPTGRAMSGAPPPPPPLNPNLIPALDVWALRLGAPAGSIVLLASVSLVPAGLNRPPVNGGAPAGAIAAWSREISVLQNGRIAMQTQMRAMLGVDNRPVHEETAATAAAARPSAAGDAMREHRLAWNAPGGLADGGAVCGPRRPLALTLGGRSRSITTTCSVGQRRRSAGARGAG
jgi:hypothetical protein